MKTDLATAFKSMLARLRELVGKTAPNETTPGHLGRIERQADAVRDPKDGAPPR